MKTALSIVLTLAITSLANAAGEQTLHTPALIPNSYTTPLTDPPRKIDGLAVVGVTSYMAGGYSWRVEYVSVTPSGDIHFQPVEKSIPFLGYRNLITPVEKVTLDEVGAYRFYMDVFRKSPTGVYTQIYHTQHTVTVSGGGSQ